MFEMIRVPQREVNSILYWCCPTVIIFYDCSSIRGKFLDSDKYGNEYKYDLFVGDVNNGYLYHFDLNKDRSGLELRGPLEDKIADTNSDDELGQIKFGEGFGAITDMDVGPDGYLYILSNQNNTPNIFKIIPLDSKWW